MNRSFPSVGVVVPAHDRRELLLKTLRAIKAQDYQGPLEILIVYDKKTPDDAMQAEFAELEIEWTPNSRTPGLVGARNTGVLALATDLIAFCDDDDVWHRRKLSKQVTALTSSPSINVVTCGIRVVYSDHATSRLAGTPWIDHSAFVRSRMAMVHSSTLLFRREFLIDMGMVNEGAPRGQNEDWDLLLRVTRTGPIRNIDEPLVDVLWGRTSFFTYAYDSKIEGIEWILSQHPEIAADRKASARIQSQLSYFQACRGLPVARRTAMQSLRADPRSWRAVLALGVSAHLVAPERVLRVLHRFGRGV